MLFQKLNVTKILRKIINKIFISLEFNLIKEKQKILLNY